MSMRILLLLTLTGFLGGPEQLLAKNLVTSPQVEHYEGASGAMLELRITRPILHGEKPSPAILLYHGGGWSNGHAWWMDGPAARFAAHGMIGISVQYRLASPQNGTSPIDSVNDALAAMRWVRTNAVRLGIDPTKIAAGGGSAGAHLATTLAILDRNGSTMPAALVLWSPAVSLTESAWFVQLFGGQKNAEIYSPLLHIRAGLPPSILFQGGSDLITPINASTEYCREMQDNGDLCELKVYPGLGHMFTRNVERQHEAAGYDNLDQDAEEDSYQRAFQFLRGIGLLR